MAHDSLMMLPEEPISIRLLGRFSVRRAADELAPAAYGGRLVRTLIRILVSRRGQFVSKDALTEALWPRQAPADPPHSLEILVVRARRALGDGSFILTQPGGYLFSALAACDVDAEGVLAAVDRGRTALVNGVPSVALPAFQEAVDRWSGEPLAEDAYAEWAQETRRELARALLDALEGGATAALLLGDPATAVALAERAASREPLREASQILYVRALAESGDRAAALAVYHSFRCRLADELGLDPSGEADRMQTRILKGEVLTAPAWKAAIEATVPLVEEFAFVGRGWEVSTILAALGGLAPVAVCISAPAGTGKTRLLAEIVARWRRPAMRVRGFLSETKTAWGLARSLLQEALALDPEAVRSLTDRETQALNGLLPGVVDPLGASAAPLDAESAHALAVQGSLKLLGRLGGGGAMVVVDDLQWADPTSLELILRLAERFEKVPLLLAWRPREGVPEAWIGNLGRRRETRSVRLRPLAPEAVADLVGAGDLARVVSTETDRTPLAVAEVLRALSEDGAAHRLPDGRWRAASSIARTSALRAARLGQERAIWARVQRLPGDALALLELLSLAGRETAGPVLALASVRSQPEVLGLLDILWQAGLASPGEDGWATAHDMVAESVKARIPPALAAQEHLALANALRAEDADSGVVAAHLAAAGEAGPAAELYAGAGAAALERFANHEAARLAEVGLALSTPGPCRLNLVEIHAEALVRLGDFPAAREELRETVAVQEPGPRRSRTLRRLAKLESGFDSYQTAADLADAAVGEAGNDERSQAEALAVRARIAMNLMDLEGCRSRVERALAIFQRLGDAAGRASVLDTEAILTLEEGHITASIELFDRAAALFANLGELFRAVMPRATRGFALFLAGRPAEAVEETDRALELARQLGYVEGEAYGLYIRSLALAELGRVDESLTDARQALERSRRLAHREWTAASLSALGAALRLAGDNRAAESTLREAQDVARALPIHLGYSTAQLVSLLVAEGRLQEAEAVLAHGVLSGRETGSNIIRLRLAAAELATARGDARASTMVADAIQLAEAGGQFSSVPRLHELALRLAAMGAPRARD